MNMKALMSVLIVAGLCFAGISVEGFTVSNNIFQPGASGVATVTVTNPSGTDRATAISMNVNSPPEIIVTGAPNLADISAGGSTVVTIPFKIRQDASPGVYLINVGFTGFVSETSGGLPQQTVNSVSVPVTVVNPPKLFFSISNESLNGIDNVSIMVTNNGGKATDLKITIPSSSSLLNANASEFANSSMAQISPVQFYGVDQIFIPEIDPNQTLIESVQFDSRNAPDGPTDVPLMLQYNDELGNPQEGASSLRLTVRNEKLDLGIAQQSEIITKQDSNLTLQITNNGQDTLSDFRLSFPDQSVSLKSQTELRFGDIAPGQTSTVTAVVTSSLPPGVNTIPASISYVEKDVQKESTLNVPITLTSDADVGVYLEAKPLPLTVGQAETISVLVSNLGSYKIDNVDVSITSPAMQSMDISDKQYIGGLQSDDFSTVQFSMNVNATSQGTYPIHIVVNYRDQSGEWKQKTFDQDINVYATAEAQQSPLPIIIGVVVLAIAVWYFAMRKKPANK